MDRKTTDGPQENNAKARSLMGFRFYLDVRFDLFDIVGSGAYGVVAAATDKATQQKVAIKKLEIAFKNIPRNFWPPSVVREVAMYRRATATFEAEKEQAELEKRLKSNAISDDYKKVVGAVQRRFDATIIE